MKWGVWCIATGAIVAKNEMRRMLRTARTRNPKYDYYVAPFVED
jgi:hypothetical protein